MIVYKLFVLDRNTWYYVTVQKSLNNYTKNVNINDSLTSGPKITLYGLTCH